MFLLSNYKKLAASINFFKIFTPLSYISRGRKLIDKSLVPKLNEKDLEEYFIKGGGPGGSKVNKSVNCVHLLHKPTGLQVKVHEHREQIRNRLLARSKLITLLDNLKNGENSVENQIKKLSNKIHIKKLQKQKKLLDLKTKWKSQ